MSEHENEDGGPAFPRTGTMTSEGYGHWEQDGMSLRDFLAAQALSVAWHAESASPTHGDTATYRGIAKRAYLMADAMLKARKA